MNRVKNDTNESCLSKSKTPPQRSPCLSRYPITKAVFRKKFILKTENASLLNVLTQFFLQGITKSSDHTYRKTCNKSRLLIFPFWILPRLSLQVDSH